MPDAIDASDDRHAELLERVRRAESARALAEAKLALAGLSRTSPWDPEDASGRAVAQRLDGPGGVGPAIDVLFQSAATALFMADAEFRYIRANQAAADLVGRAVPDLIGCHVLDFTAPADLEVTRRALDALSGGQFLVKRYIRPDGSLVPAMVTAWPLVDDDGRVICTLAVVVPLARVGAQATTLRALLDEALRPEG